MVDDGAVAVLVVDVTAPPPMPTTSVPVTNNSVGEAELFVVFDDADVPEGLLLVRVEKFGPPVPVGSAKTNTVPSTVVETPAQRRLVHQEPT